MPNTVPAFPSSFHKIPVFPQRTLNLFPVIASRSSGIKRETTKFPQAVFSTKVLCLALFITFQVLSYNTHSQHYNFYFPLLKLPWRPLLHISQSFFWIFLLLAPWLLPWHLLCLPDPGKFQLMSPDWSRVFCFSSFRFWRGAWWLLDLCVRFTQDFTLKRCKLL